MNASKVIIFFLLVSCSTSKVWVKKNLAGETKSCTSIANSFISNNTIKSSVEVELTLNEKVMNLLTTIDGTVGPVLDGFSIPSWFEKNYGNPKNINWNDLDFETKISLLRHQTSQRAANKNWNFFNNRSIIGLKVKDTFSINSDHNFEFMGQKYTPGEHQIQLAKYFGKVEFAGPESVAKVSGVELHIRSDLASGQVVQDVWNFFALAGITKPAQHIHIVGNLPKKDFGLNPLATAARMGLFYTKANMTAEMASVYFDGGTISSIKKNNIYYFKSLTRENLSGVVNYFVKLAKGNWLTKIMDNFKLAWVGMRGSDFYDEPGKWGLEYRAVNAHSKITELKPILNALHHEILTQKYSLSVTRLHDWANYNQLNLNLNELPDTIAHTWPEGSLFEQASANKAIVNLLINQDKKLTPLGKEIENLNSSEYFLELKWLVHNWDGDIVTFDNPVLKENILKAQIAALEELAEFVPWGKSFEDLYETINPTIKKFLKDSGLLKAYLESIGIKI